MSKKQQVPFSIKPSGLEIVTNGATTSGPPVSKPIASGGSSSTSGGKK